MDWYVSISDMRHMCYKADILDDSLIGGQEAYKYDLYFSLFRRPT